jgi:stress-induced morphogen
MDQAMPMNAGDIERLIKEKLPDANVVSAAFKGKSRVQQHQMVYDALGGRMGGVLHALALTTGLPAD